MLKARRHTTLALVFGCVGLAHASPEGEAAKPCTDIVARAGRTDADSDAKPPYDESRVLIDRTGATRVETFVDPRFPFAQNPPAKATLPSDWRSWIARSVDGKEWAIRFPVAMPATTKRLSVIEVDGKTQNVSYFQDGIIQLDGVSDPFVGGSYWRLSSESEIVIITLDLHPTLGDEIARGLREEEIPRLDATPFWYVPSNPQSEYVRSLQAHDLGQMELGD